MDANTPLNGSEMAQDKAGVEQVSESPAYVLPSLEKGPASFFDPDSKSFWLGIPIDRTDYITALAVVDSVKLNLLQNYQAEAVRQAQSSKIVKPGWAEKARQNGAALLQKLGMKH